MLALLVILLIGLALRWTDDKYIDVPDKEKDTMQNLVAITADETAVFLPGIFRWDMVLAILSSILCLTAYTTCGANHDTESVQVPRSAVGVPDMLLGISRVVNARTFISYSWKDGDQYSHRGLPAMGALPLARSLARALPSSWVDVQFMENARENPFTMKKAVEKSMAAVLLLTPGYFYGKWCMLELMYVLHDACMRSEQEWEALSATKLVAFVPEDHELPGLRWRGTRPCTGAVPRGSREGIVRALEAMHVRVVTRGDDLVQHLHDHLLMCWGDTGMEVRGGHGHGRGHGRASEGDVIGRPGSWRAGSGAKSGISDDGTAHERDNESQLPIMLVTS